MKNNFPHVFSPLTIRGMTLKNRVVMMPMESDFAGHDGKLSDEHIKIMSCVHVAAQGFCTCETYH